MRDERPIKTARRRARQHEREALGIAVPPCSLCIQEHHTVGRNHDSRLTDFLCEMHHSEVHEDMLTAAIPLTFEPDPVKRVATMLRAEAVYERKKADAKERMADLLDHSGG